MRCPIFHFIIPLMLLPFVCQAAPPDSPVAQPQNPTMVLFVDASEAPRHILHVQMDIPAKPGPLTLVYPKWLPGEHAPNGPIVNVVNVIFTVEGRPLVWQRDSVDLFAFHLSVPRGASSIHATFDLLTPAAGGLTSDNLGSIVWTSLILYPQERAADGIDVAARLRLPAGWKFATALPVARQEGDTVTFQPAPLVTLLDSPLIAGVYTKVVPLTAPGAMAPVEIDLVGDTPDAIAIPDSQVQACKNLVTEANALWGAHHYRSYHFLYILSDYVQGEGLEHHESSQDTEGADIFTREPKRGGADLLPHEYTHSWCGKYRRPYDLYTSDYQKPMRDDLLWVYEGLTQYYGDVLTARCGLWTPEEFRDELAGVAAYFDHEPGRAWRPLVDTAISSPILYGTRGEWQSIRRSDDYYDEMVLVWLEADMQIRRLTGDKKNLDDFAKLFAGGPSTPPQVKTYTFDEIVQTLNAVAPFDWKGFLTARVYAIAPRAPLGGIEASGWKLIYNDTESEAAKSREKRYGVNLSYSLGFSLNKDGKIRDVIPGTPAAQIGLAPGMTLVAVNGHHYSDDTIKDAVKDRETHPGPMALLIESDEEYKTYQIDYHGGLLYPHLERDTAKPDLLAAVTAPVTPRPNPQGANPANPVSVPVEN